MLGVMATILAALVIAIIAGAIWADGADSTTWEEIEYFKNDETE